MTTSTQPSADFGKDGSTSATSMPLPIAITPTMNNVPPMPAIVCIVSGLSAVPTARFKRR
ncbi:hypothetical protein D3C71_1757550 [compost metagenome]